VWGALPNDAVYAARYQHLRTRLDNPLKDGQARAAIAPALLRQLFVVITRRVAWNPSSPLAGPRRWSPRPHDATLAAGGANPHSPWEQAVAEQGRPAQPPPELA
jgi:hypothetical protein